MNFDAGTGEKHSEVFWKAAKVLNEKGYHGASMQDIANEVGIQKGSLYYYISSKQDLLRGMVVFGIGIFQNGMKEIVESADSPQGKLKRAIQHHLLPLQESHDVAAVFLKEVKNVDKESRKLVNQHIREYHGCWEQILLEGVEKGQFKKDINVRLYPYLIIGMCNSVERWYNPEGFMPIEQIGEMISKIVLEGLGSSQLQKK